MTATEARPANTEVERLLTVLYGPSAERLGVRRTDDPALDLSGLLSEVAGTIDGQRDRIVALERTQVQPGQIVVERPHVPHGPKGVPTEQADAAYLRQAARNIEHSRCMGSNLTRTVTRLLHEVADALESSRP